MGSGAEKSVTVIRVECGSLKVEGLLNYTQWLKVELCDSRACKECGVEVQSSFLCLWLAHSAAGFYFVCNKK